MPGGHSCIESVVFLQPLLEILSSYLIHTTHFARADSRAVLSLLPCRYPRIGSFTTLKSWISKSDLGTTEEIALLPTLRESSSDQDYASDEASNDDIHSPPSAKSDCWKNASGCVRQAAARQAGSASVMQFSTCAYLGLPAALPSFTFSDSFSPVILKLVTSRVSQVS